MRNAINGFGYGIHTKYLTQRRIMTCVHEWMGVGLIFITFTY